MPPGFGSEYRTWNVLCSRRKTGAQHAGAGWGGGSDHCGGGGDHGGWALECGHHQGAAQSAPVDPRPLGASLLWSGAGARPPGVGGDWAASSPALPKPQFPARPGQGLQKALRSWEPQGPGASSFRLSERGEARGCPAPCPWPGVGCPQPIHPARLSWPPRGQYWVSVQVGHSSWVSGSSHWVSQPLGPPVSRTLFLTQQGAPPPAVASPPSLPHLFQAAQGLAGCCPQWAGEAGQGVTLGLESDVPDG